MAVKFKFPSDGEAEFAAAQRRRHRQGPATRSLVDGSAFLSRDARKRLFER